MPSNNPTTLRLYSDALLLLGAKDKDGTVLTPDAVLAHYSDGWRMVAPMFDGKVRTTGYTIDPLEGIKSIEANSNAQS